MDVALALKQGIRNKVSPPKDSARKPTYVVDAFEAAAKKYSRGGETAANGGLLGELVPQGYCRAGELDEACFRAPLGDVCGPDRVGGRVPPAAGHGADELREAGRTVY